ncbi:uncharacterized protein LOC128964501 [Oppia nitens]|uniref:uncharacterized protein LOC128964501 n=1 Tax=Oppia nitens TaxID=1686743 RepID=UPI0023D98A80|nr:uncharacterized protein LOC128964501 [Oppia nitens]
MAYKLTNQLEMFCGEKFTIDSDKLNNYLLKFNKMMTEFIDQQLIDNSNNSPNDRQLTNISEPQLRDVGQWFKKLIDYIYRTELDIGGNNIYMYYNCMLSIDQSAPGDNDDDRRPLIQLSDDQLIALGWIDQLVVIYFVMIDDIVDQSDTRFGKTCWHLLPDVGMIALNDCTLILSVVFKLAKHYFKGHPCYMDIVECIHETIENVSIGQSMDLMNTKSTNKHAQFEQYTDNCWTTISKYKEACFAILYPFKLVMTATGQTNQKDRHIIEECLVKCGRLTGAYNDYSDVYVKSNGTDIAEGKCSWLYVRALEMASPEQRSVLLDNYGLGADNHIAVDKIKLVYSQLNMKQEFCEYIGQIIDSIENSCLKQLSSSTSRQLVSKIVLVYYNWLQKVYSESK